MKKKFLALTLLVLTACDGYYMVKKDVEVGQTVPENCIKSSIFQSFSSVKINQEKNTDTGVIYEISWKDADNRDLNGTIQYPESQTEVNLA